MSCETSRRSTRRRRSSGGPRRCRWPSRPPASRACSITRASAPWRAWRRADGDPHRAVDGRDDDARGRSRPPLPTCQVVPALHVARPRRERRADRARAGRRLPRARAHGRRRRWRARACATSTTASSSPRARRCARWATWRCTRPGGRTCSPPSRCASPRSKSPPTTVARVASLFDAALTPDDVTWLRGLWDGPLVVKGILTADDARLVGRPRRRRRGRLQPRLAPARPLAHAAGGAAGDRRGGRRPRRGLPGLGDPHAAPTSSPRWPWAPARASSPARTATG